MYHQNPSKERYTAYTMRSAVAQWFSLLYLDLYVLGDDALIS